MTILGVLTRLGAGAVAIITLGVPADSLEVSGMVRTTSGDPVAGARVLFIDEGPDRRGFLAVTDGDGRYRIDANTPTAVDDQGVNPSAFALHQSYPNPFNPSTVISYTLPHAGPVRLNIYNSLGQRVRTLVDEWHQAGHHATVWDARTDGGQGAAAGVYIYRLEYRDRAATRKMVLTDGTARSPATVGIDAGKTLVQGRASTYRVTISAPGVVTHDQVRRPVADGEVIDFDVEMADGGLRPPFPMMTFVGQAAASGALGDMPRQLQIPWRNMDDKEFDTEQLERFNAMFFGVVDLSDRAYRDADIAAAMELKELYRELAVGNAFYRDEECNPHGGDEHWRGGYLRSLITNGLAFSYMKIQPSIEERSPADAAAIELWFEVMQQCSRNRAELMIAGTMNDPEGPHNMRYPALSAIMTSSIILDDVATFDWAVSRLRDTLARLRDDGSALSEILHKGASAYHYHMTIVNWVVHMAVMGELNDRSVMGEDGFRHLVELMTRAHDNPQYFEDETDEDQLHVLERPWDYGWMVHLRYLRPDPRLEGALQTFRTKMFHEQTGGDPWLWWEQGP